MKKLIFKIKIFFAKLFASSKTRQKIRQQELERLEKLCKVGASYSVWDGEELLEASIKSIRDNVDYINVVWQRLSWHGNPCDENLPNFLQSLKDKGLIDEIIEWEPDLSGKLKFHNQNELNKRNVGLDYVKKAGCNYFLLMDTDEFYDKEQFRNTKLFMIKNNITHSIAHQVIYTKKPTFQSQLSSTFYIPFLYKINENSKLSFDGNGSMPCHMDPTHQIELTNDDKLYLFAPSEIVMHHMSGVRKSIDKKYKNISTRIKGNEKNVDKQQQDHDDLNENNLSENGYIKVPNKFNIEI